LRKRIAGFGKEFWEIDEKINSEYHDSSYWDNSSNNYSSERFNTKNGIKVINEIHNRNNP